MSITIVTDSCAYLTPEALERYGISVVSLYVNVAGEAIRESDITDYATYFRQLGAAAELPTTSQPSIGDFLAVYEPLVAAGHEVLSLHLSGGMSGTAQTAEQARAQLGEGVGRVRVLDTKVACGAEGLMVHAAATAVSRGADLDGAIAAAEEARDGLKFWFALDSLEYLRKGGRVGGAQAWLGSALKIKPILSLAEQITPVERVRTTRRAFERVVALLEGAHAEGRDGWAIQHIQSQEYADQLLERGRAIFGREPLFMNEIGPVIGTHVGPGFFGAGAYPLDLVA
jgi:DegV family protein with EDD domain